MTRRVFFLGLIAYGLLTGLFYRIINLIDRVGWTDAAVYVFSISVIVWVAVYIGLELIIEADDDEPVGKLDEVVGITGLLLCSLPYAPLAWLGVTILAGWLVITTVPQTTLHRGALILLATTFPMLWSRVIFKFLSGPILLVDAWIVAKLLGTSSEGTHIAFVDKSGFLEVSPACSSWANISLVLLTWMVISQYQRRRWASSGLRLVRFSGAHHGSDQHHPYGDDGYLGRTLFLDSRHCRINHHKLDDHRGNCSTVFVGNAF